MNLNPLARTFAKALHLIIVAVLAAGLTLNVQPVSVAGAADYTVTKTADTNDGACDADCSLREAIAVANAAPEADEITLPAGTYNLTLGVLNLTSPLTLTGALSSTTIIHGTPNSGVIYIGSGAAGMLANVTIRGSSSIYAGGINNYGTLTLNDSIVTQNIGVIGGGIYNFGALMLNRSAVVGNTAGSSGLGGGIYNGGTFTLTDSLIAGNTSGRGGGLYNNGTAVILSSTLSNNITYITGLWQDKMT